MTDKQRILNRAARLQAQGRTGDSLKLRILAGELKTVRYGPVGERDTP